MYAKTKYFIRARNAMIFEICVKIISDAATYLCKQCSIFNQWQQHCHRELKTANVAKA